ncbi:acyltransferase [Pseudoalteromonas sp. C2R02]|uniref:acyltransferase n=1 Tax=Pseudoalteromonas sp. C2R02 TaxID=2841565 RepID=UPI00209033E2|nr:acyltransferase [Pseudoalteromonas sp. C2R02]
MSGDKMNPFNPGYYTDKDLKNAGFKSIGKNVQIGRNCTIIGLENIEIGDNVRIDGYCTIIAAGSGWLKIGSYIHIGSYCLLSAGDGIQLHDFSGLSQGVCIYSRTDDYSGKYLTNPTVPAAFTGVSEGTVTLGRHVIVGSGSVILPNVTVGEGSSIGAQSLVTKNLEEWGVFFGTPVKRLKRRSQKLLELEKNLLSKSA